MTLSRGPRARSTEPPGSRFSQRCDLQGQTCSQCSQGAPLRGPSRGPPSASDDGSQAEQIGEAPGPPGAARKTYRRLPAARESCGVGTSTYPGTSDHFGPPSKASGLVRADRFGRPVRLLLFREPPRHAHPFALLDFESGRWRTARFGARPDPGTRHGHSRPGAPGPHHRQPSEIEASPCAPTPQGPSS
jgi:hypothetical protein